jgi:hypothetical protein
MMQQQGDAANANANFLAQSALETAEKALQAARTSAVQVKPLGDRILITMPSSDGNRHAIEVSADGKQILSVDGMSTAAIMPPQEAPRRDISKNAIPLLGIVCGMVAITTIFGPIMKALGRRLEQRGAPAPADLSRRLGAIEQAVEAVAVEVERISEGQRFTTKLLADRENEGVMR